MYVVRLESTPLAVPARYRWTHRVEVRIAESGTAAPVLICTSAYVRPPSTSGMSELVSEYSVQVNFGRGSATCSVVPSLLAVNVHEEPDDRVPGWSAWITIKKYDTDTGDRKEVPSPIYRCEVERVRTV